MLWRHSQTKRKLNMRTAFVLVGLKATLCQVLQLAKPFPLLVLRVPELFCRPSKATLQMILLRYMRGWWSRVRSSRAGEAEQPEQPLGTGSTVPPSSGAVRLASCEPGCNTKRPL